MTEPDKDNPRGRFYLEHREAIEEWAALRADARELLESTLFGLEGPLSAFAAENAAELLVDPEEPYPSLTLYRPSWQSSRRVRVAIGVAWERRRLLVPGPYNEWPWVGVWVDDEPFRRREALVAGLKGLRAAHGFAGRSSGYHLWRYVQPTAGLLNPDAYASDVLRQVETVWATTSEVVDQALR